MRRRLGLRVRLTAVVSAAFALAFIGLAVLALDRVEAELRDDTRETAERLLFDYFEGASASDTTAEVAPEEGTRFFYLDDAGGEIGEDAFVEALYGDLDDELDLDFDSSVMLEDLAFDVCFGDEVDPAYAERCAEIDRTLAAELEALEESEDESDEPIFAEAPEPELDPEVVDQGDQVVAVVQTIPALDGRQLGVGVSMPLRPVDDSLRAIRRLLWFSAPILVGAVALITWLVTGRALRPVEVMTRRVDEISQANLGDRVPIPDTDDEIQHLAVTMNRMLDRLDRAQRRQQEFVSDASHELQSPITASQAQLEVALAAPDVADWPATARTVLAEQAALTQLVDDFLTLGRVDEGGGERHDVDLDDIVLAETSRVSAVPVTVGIARPVRVRGDGRLLARAVRNLVDNAVRHADSKVDVTLDEVEGRAVVVVDDDGPGVPPEQRARIFERFARVDEARDRARGGAGLGLAIAAGVAQAHGGTVEVGDGALGGARFTLVIPIGVDVERPAGPRRSEP